MTIDRRRLLAAAGLSATLPWWALPGCATLGTGRAAVHRMVFALRGDGAVVAIDSETDAVAARIPTGGAGGTLGSLTPDGRWLYVANNAAGQRTLVKIDTQSLRVAATLETGNRPKHPVVSPDGRRVALNHSGVDGGKIRIAFVDVATDRVRSAEIAVRNAQHAGDFSMHGAWLADGRHYAIGNYADNEVVVIDAETLQQHVVAVEGNPHYFDVLGRQLWVTLEAGEPKSAQSRPVVAIFDAANPMGLKRTGEVAMTLSAHETANPARIEGHHGNFTPDRQRFLVCNRGAGSALEGGSLDVFDVNTRQRLAHLELGIKGAGHAYLTPDGRHALVTQYNDTRVPVLDLQSLRVVATIDAGGGGHLGHAAFTADGRKVYLNNRKGDEVLVVDTSRWAIVKRVATATSGQAQAMVLNTYYGVFERVGPQALLA
ncbi:YncE family protein [Tepidimonas sp.]|uniref:YncE family protein n=1 Tax=Tepidimonas sp. TaxID=2002775 RepID=UPI00391D2DCF